MCFRMEFDFDAIEEEDSPFPEVRASVSNIDDPEMPCMTLRMWFIGLLLVMVTGCVAYLFLSSVLADRGPLALRLFFASPFT